MQHDGQHDESGQTLDNEGVISDDFLDDHMVPAATYSQMVGEIDDEISREMARDEARLLESGFTESFVLTRLGGGLYATICTACGAVVPTMAFWKFRHWTSEEEATVVHRRTCPAPLSPRR